MLVYHHLFSSPSSRKDQTYWHKVYHEAEDRRLMKCIRQMTGLVGNADIRIQVSRMVAIGMWKEHF